MTSARRPPETPPLRIDLDAENVGTGFAQLVITVMEIIRELLERQALRRVDAGDLTPEQIERLGSGLRDIACRLDELRQLVARPDAARQESPASPVTDPVEPAGTPRRNP